MGELGGLGGQGGQGVHGWQLLTLVGPKVM